ncbi:MAG: STAS domain-containing protein [Candidatus Electryonea clarkiae]|nr:STAS domain-containing protein [Candidatus Electryonea clarkiae]MDP8289292.1 STAS domain-containing protein [Candidatus Electryonea clarkiae]
MKAKPLMLTAERKDDIAIFHTHGYVDDECGEVIAKRFEEYWSLGIKDFLFDMSDSKLASTLGVGVLIEIIRQINDSVGTMAFCNCNKVISTTFKIMGLAKYTKIYRTMEEALEGMS